MPRPAHRSPAAPRTSAIALAALLVCAAIAPSADPLRADARGTADDVAATTTPAVAATATPAVPARIAALRDNFEARVTRHVLDNGWTFLLIEREGAPVFSFATFVDVGSAQEVPGITGLAHMFEHMAFKGTPNIGTTDYAAEAETLEAVEAAYLAWQAADMAPRPDAARVAALEAAFRARQAEAAAFVVPNEFGELVEREGGVGLNAATSADQTFYFYSLPANKIELFAYLESERFLRPVFREFYKERDVVQEERRMAVGSRPTGRLLEQLRSAAYVAHPYGQPVVGHMSDLRRFTATDAKRFYETHYVPGNMTTAIAGAIDPATLIPMLETYFGRMPAGPKPPPLRTIEPPQTAETIIRLEAPVQPTYTEFYHRPSGAHPDAVVLAAIDDVLSNGRTGRFYRTLTVAQKQVAFTSVFPSFPGDKYPSLFGIIAVPNPGVTLETVRDGIHAELARLRDEPVSDDELARFKSRATATVLRSMQSDLGIAFRLAQAEMRHGDWRQSFDRLAAVHAVTAEDIQRVARATFRAENRTVGKVVPRAAETPDDRASTNAPSQGDAR
ncbi:MAG: pitrilysin family protein [Acidobacteriota bacterium]